MRNAVIHQLSENEYVTITGDNSGGIGEKEADVINASYEELSYYAFRVAVMECLASGGEPVSVFLDNFNGDSNWVPLENGIRRGLGELGLESLPITGSSESNFSLVQSALGVVVVGKATHVKHSLRIRENAKWAVLGEPLVGQDVLDKPEAMIPLRTFQQLGQIKEIDLWPVGSRGILAELERIHGSSHLNISSPLDVQSSSGPSTCTLATFPQEFEESIQALCGTHYHPLSIT